MSKTIFKHELKDAYGMPLGSITIKDYTKDNLIINEEKITLSNDLIEKIKELLNNKDLELNAEVVFPPVLDGTIHELFFNDKKIECCNLWYFKYDSDYEENEVFNKEDIKYTKAIVNLIKEIQKILNNNNIDVDILEGSEDY